MLFISAEKTAWFFLLLWLKRNGCTFHRTTVRSSCRSQQALSNEVSLQPLRSASMKPRRDMENGPFKIFAVACTPLAWVVPGSFRTNIPVFRIPIDRYVLFPYRYFPHFHPTFATLLNISSFFEFFWKFLQNGKLTSGNFLGFSAIPAKFRHIFDEQLKIMKKLSVVKIRNVHRHFAKWIKWCAKGNIFKHASNWC